MSKFYTFEKCRDLSKLVETKNEFWKLYRGAYAACLRNVWGREILNTLKDIRKPNGYYSREKCFELSKCFSTRRDFRAEYPRAYAKAISEKWEECFSHMTRLGSLHEKHVYMIKKENVVYVGITNNLERRLRNHRTNSKMVKAFGNDFDYSWTSDLLKSTEAVKIEIATISRLKDDPSITLINKHIGGGIGSAREIWTYEKCKTEAMKYQFRTEFSKGSPSAYTSSSEKGWLKEICSHMPERKIAKIRKWTYEKCKTEAMKYTRRVDFARNASQAYQASWKNGWLNEFFPPCQSLGATEANELRERIDESLGKGYTTVTNLPGVT